MKKFSAYGELLSASADDRTLTYRLLPFGEKSGLTGSGHRFTADKNSVTVPSDISHLVVNTEHNQIEPVGRFESIETKPDGIYASIRISDFDRGDAALLAARDGSMRGISVEVRNPVIRSGHLIAGELTGAGLCKSPSIGSAVLMASDTGDTAAALNTLSEAIEALKTAMSPEITPEDETLIDDLESQIEDTADAPEADAPTPTEEDELSNLKATNAAKAPAAKFSTELIAKAYSTKDVKLAAGLSDLGLVGEENLFAALSPVTSTANTGNVEQAQWLGELWTKNPYVRKYVNLLGSAPLTAWKIEGWRFTSDITIGDYAGDLAEIPTGAVTTEPYSDEAQRVAHGIKVDRKYRDFGNTEFLNSLFAAQTEGYARKTDLIALARIMALATPVEGNDYVAGVARGNTRIVDGALEILKTTNSLPTFAIVSYDLYREMLLTTEFDNLKFISESLGLESGNISGFQIVPSNDVPADTVLVGSKNALEARELGGSPIRVEALDVSHGGTDEAIFGYIGFAEHNPEGIVSVSAPALP